MDALNDAEVPTSGFIDNGSSKTKLRITKEFQCSFKDFASLAERRKPNPLPENQERVPFLIGKVLMKSEDFSFEMNGVKYLDCEVAIFQAYRSSYDAWTFGIYLKNIKSGIRVFKVEGKQVNQWYDDYAVLEDNVGENFYPCGRVVCGISEIPEFQNTLLDKDGSLIVAFKMTIKLDHKMENESVKLACDYKELLTNAEQFHADTIIHCNDGKIRAHKGILAARSEYFDKMLSTKMKEGLSGEIEVKHMEMSVCRTILEYIYSGKVESSQLNVEILAEAEKMGLFNLKKECSTKLIQDLSAGNCVKMIQAGDLHKDEDLKNKAKEFIIENYEDLTDKSKAALFQYPDIARDIYESTRNRDLPVAKRRRVM